MWDNGVMRGEALQPDGSWKAFSVPLYDFFEVMVDRGSNAVICYKGAE